MFWKQSLVFVVTLLIKGCDAQGGPPPPPPPSLPPSLPPPPSLTPVCGRAPLNTKIVGGVNASAGAWPWQVSLHADGSHFCGGSLINNQWVLSAAHCFQGTSAGSITVYLGRQSQELPNPNELSRSVAELIVHQDYDSLSHNNDMALLRLASPVNFTDYIQPVCLAAQGSTFNGDMMWLTGWGTVNSGVPLPSPQILQEVAVPLVGNNQCNCAYSGKITDNMMCAGLPEGGKDTCQGDSGGPMVIRQGSTWIQAGVVSFGYGCALPNIPGVYARVSQYQQWISEQISQGVANFLPFQSTAPPQNENVTCPTTPPPILCGGSAASWPWMVGLSHYGHPKCIGTLVSERLIMTSASCFSGSYTYGWTATLSVAHWDCSSYTVTVDVANIIYDNVFGNAIALVELSDPFSYVANVLVDMYNLEFGPVPQCAVIGLDLEAASGPSFSPVHTTIVNCDPSVSSQFICTEALDQEKLNNGSPLLCNYNGMWVQTGLLAIHPGSETHPQPFNSTVFFRTSPFSTFLTETINDYPSILDGAESFSPLSLVCILLLSFPAVLQAIY